MDSIDKKNNKFKISNLVFGYTFKNSFKKTNFNYAGLLDLSSLSFNTVQGYNLASGFSYFTGKDEKGKRIQINTDFNYGFSEERLRVTGRFYHRFNNKNYANLTINGGTKVEQFNSNEPISTFINSSSTLFFKSNYMKLYNLEFARISYGQDVANGININGKVEYLQRKPLFNTTDFTILKSEVPYTSNNPLDENDFIKPGFEEHHLIKLGLNAQINFGNKYFSRPDGKFNFRNEKYPTLFLGFEKAVAGSDKKYEFEHLSTRIFYDINMGNKGNLAMNLKAGKLFNATDIAFMDYKHFNGNQTHIGGTDRYLNVFNFMPYYTNSTNDSYFEAHIEHNDQGFFTNKIPLINKLKCRCFW